MKPEVEWLVNKLLLLFFSCVIVHRAMQQYDRRRASQTRSLIFKNVPELRVQIISDSVLKFDSRIRSRKKNLAYADSEKKICNFHSCDRQISNYLNWHLMIRFPLI